MIHSILSQAIQDKRPVSATYDGYLREFCPHVLGYKYGVLRVLGYQFGGDSSNGSVKGEWKCFLVSQLHSLAFITGDWCTDLASSHSLSQRCIDNVIAQVLPESGYRPLEQR
jgi:hypothetical protein